MLQARNNGSHGKFFLYQMVALAVVIVGVGSALPSNLRHTADHSATVVSAAVVAAALGEVMRRRVFPHEVELAVYRGSGWAKMIAHVLVNVLHAIITAVVALLSAYTVATLNPGLVHVLFATVAFTAGLLAWQATLALIMHHVKQRPHYVAVVVCVVGAGVILNGQLLPFSSLPQVLRYSANLLVISVLQRALVVNDLHCCHLSVTCNALRKDGYSSNQDCPVALRFSGDGSDAGNLGREYLTVSCSTKLNSGSVPPVLTACYPLTGSRSRR
jgi:hypothetical protein